MHERTEQAIRAGHPTTRWQLVGTSPGSLAAWSGAAQPQRSTGQRKALHITAFLYHAAGTTTLPSKTALLTLERPEHRNLQRFGIVCAELGGTGKEINETADVHDNRILLTEVLRGLKGRLNGVVEQLNSERLPESIPTPKVSDMVKNPFD